MPVTINGDGSITGLAVGGLGNGGIVDADSIAANAVTTAKLANGAATQAKRTYATGELIQSKYIERTASRANAHNGNSWSEALESQFRVAITPTAVGNTIVAHCFIGYTAGQGTLGGMVPVFHDGSNQYAMAGDCGSSAYVAPANVLSNTGFVEDLRNNTGNTNWFNVLKVGRYKTTNTNASTVRLYSRNGSGTFTVGDNAMACSILVLEYQGDIDLT